MVKKLALMVVAILACVTANAQFERGKVYVGASLSGLDLSYNGTSDGKIGLQTKGGYLFMDNLMAVGQLSYENQKDKPAYFSAGVAARYYIVQNGIFLSLGTDYYHFGDDHDDFMPTFSVGYAFFLSRTVTVEPEIYYNQSFKNHSDYSTVGLRIGVGVYL